MQSTFKRVEQTVLFSVSLKSKGHQIKKIFCNFLLYFLSTLMVSECRRDELLLNKQFKEWFIRSSRESFSILGGVDPPAVFALRKWVHSLLLVP